MTALRWLAVAVACLTTGFSPVPEQGPSLPSGRALVISDIHFDPLADPEIVGKLIAAPATQWSTIFEESGKRAVATYGSDTDYPLLQSALAGAQANGPYDYALFTGDALRHDFGQAFTASGGTSNQFAAFAAKTQSYVIDQLQSRLGVPVLLAVGNDDSDCGDYRLAPAGAYLAATAGDLDSLASDPVAQQDFARGGYYSLAHPVTAGQRIIVLNSVFWSPSYSDCAAPGADPGTAEIDWLTTQLAAARAAHQGITLVMHIPPGMDAYASSSQGDCTATPLIAPGYADLLGDLLRDNADLVQVAFASHTHMDDFRLPTIATASIPLRVNPSISPIFGNNPAFTVYSYDPRTAAPLDFVGTHAELGVGTPEWTTEYRFSSTYQVPAFDRGGVASAITSIAGGAPALRAYEQNYASGAASPIDSSHARFYTCAQSDFSRAGYRACVCPN